MANSDSLLPFPRWASPSEAATYGKIGTIDAPAYSCVGFAMMAHWFIYAQKNTDNVAAEHIATINLSSSAQANLTKYAREGDILVFRTSKTNGNYSHAAIYTGCTGSAVKVLDSNWGGSTGNTCKMQEHTIPYSTYAYVEISRATNATDETVAATSVSLATTEINLGKGNTYALSATVSPSNATNKAVTWSSSNTAVATVSSSGVVKGIAPGQATITATTKDGSHKATCTVTVSGDVYTITFDLNGGEWDEATIQTKNEGEDLSLIDATPTRPGYTFLGWELPVASIKDGEWVAEKPSDGDYETGYKYYTYGYEHNSDYTYMYGPNKDSLIATVKEYPDGYGTYSASKLRYFWLIEDTNQGESFYPAKVSDTANNFKASYISEAGATGTATLRNTNFYFESVVYKQDPTGFYLYQPGESFTWDQNVTLSAFWIGDTGDSTVIPPSNDGTTGDCTWSFDGSTLTISGNGAMAEYSTDEPAPWSHLKDSINTIIIEPGVMRIGSSAFRDCNKATDVMVANTVVAIGNGAFSGCTSLNFISLSTGLLRIDASAFHNCQSLTSITLYENVSTIDIGAFNYCNSLTDITVDTSNAYYSSIDGVLFNKDATTLICYPAGKTNTSYTVPDGVKTIGRYDSFFNCENLTSVILPASVETIENCAFLTSYNISEITLGKGLTTIENNAFLHCSSLSDVWYAGSETDRSNIFIDETGNDKIVNATWHYTNSTESDTPDNVYHDVAYLNCSSFYPHPGDTINIYLTVPESIAVRSLGIEELSYDMEKLELISGEWLLDNALISDWNNDNRIGAATFLENTNIQDNILKLTFKIKDDASECDLNFSLDFKGTLMNDNTETTIFYNTELMTVPVRILDPIEIAVSDVDCRPGETIEVFLSIPEATTIKTIGIPFIMYDNSILELIDGEWLLDTAIVSDWNTEELIGAMTFAENTVVSGNFIKFTFTVKDDAPEGTTNILCAMTLKQMVGNFEATIPHQTFGGFVTITHILPGDMDGNEAVNSNDVVFLLYHTLFPSMYPANQNSDFNHDGAINSNDVIFLLYHTLFPSMYPLS